MDVTDACLSRYSVRHTMYDFRCTMYSRHKAIVILDDDLCTNKNPALPHRVILFSKLEPRISKLILYSSLDNTALVYSLFNLAILFTDISFGQAASHASVNVHEPNPSLSICAIIFTTRVFLSGSHCGNNAKCAIFAEVNNIAELFLQAATQAPQPIQAAAANAVSALSFSIGKEFPS